MRSISLSLMAISVCACRCDSNLISVADDAGVSACAEQGLPCQVTSGPCGGTGVYVCDPDGGAPVCASVSPNPVNACGGCTELAAKPGDPCGACGTYGCIGADFLACGDPGKNACGGCKPLSAAPGSACGICGTYACSGNDALTCSNDNPNACGGCAILPAKPGDPCTANGVPGTYVCAGSDSLICVTNGCVVFTNPDFCPSTGGWVPRTRWGYEYAALESGPPCIAHGVVGVPDGGSWPSPGYGVATFAPTGSQKLCISATSYVCVEYETPVMAGLGGSCAECDGPGYQDCVANLGASLTFYDSAGNVLSAAYAGPRTWGIGDSSVPNVTAAGSLTSDGVVYDMFTCTKNGTPQVFLHAEDPSRHHFRAKVSDLVPAGEQPVSATWEVGHSYPNDPPSEPTEMKVYSAFLGTPNSYAFCNCLGGSWNGSACLGI